MKNQSSVNSFKQLNRLFDKFIVTVPKAMSSGLKQYLKKNQLPEPERFNFSEIVKNAMFKLDFYKLIDIYSRKKKNYLLKILLNDAGIDVSKGESGGYKFESAEGAYNLAKNTLDFLSEQGPVVKPQLDELDDVEKAETTSVMSTVPAEEIESQQQETEEVSESTKVETEA